MAPTVSNEAGALEKTMPSWYFLVNPMTLSLGRRSATSTHLAGTKGRPFLPARLPPRPAVNRALSASMGRSLPKTGQCLPATRVLQAPAANQDDACGAARASRSSLEAVV